MIMQYQSCPFSGVALRSQELQYFQNVSFCCQGDNRSTRQQNAEEKVSETRPEDSLITSGY